MHYDLHVECDLELLVNYDHNLDLDLKHLEFCLVNSDYEIP